jgi:hypothetical protein
MNNLPKSFKKFFWDCEFNQLDINQHQEFILKRLMEFGNIDAIRFILSEISLKDASQLLNTKGKSVLSHRNFLFWNKLVKHDELWQR